MKRTLILLWSALVACTMLAQVTSSPSPIPVNYTGEIILTFDPTKGNGGMATATACYSHIGLIMKSSSSSSDWKYVKGTWGTTSEPAWTKVGSNWQLTIPNLYSYFSCPTTDTIVAIAMVFHDGKGSKSKEGKTATNGDILIALGEERPSDIWEGFVPAEVTEQPRPTGISNGIYYGEDGTSVTLCTYAASKTEPAKHVFLIGDMTDWNLSNDYQLYRDSNYFWITLTGLEKGKEYRFQYAVMRADSVKKQISDLYSEKLLHPDDKYEPRTTDPTLLSYPMYGADGGYVSVIQPGKSTYQWSDATLNFVRPDKNNLIIYELWVYDYTPERNFKGLIKRLPYLQHLGVNAIELMPVSEFDGNYNWGYSPNHYFALDKAYGTPDMFRQLIDSCHARGMAVIIDMVFNHITEQNPMNKLYPPAEISKNPWLNAKAPHGDVFYQDWNHDFAPAKEMFVRALQYWLREYKVDGFRMDLSHGFCGTTDQSMDNIEHYYNQGVKSVTPDAYFILEHWGSRMQSERPQLIQKGMLCWHNINNAYSQLAMGWISDDNISEANRDGYVSYCESHDEERNFYKAKTYGKPSVMNDQTTRLNRVSLTLAFNLLLNGPHMIWQYNELGFDYSINSTKGSTTLTSDNRCNIKEQPESLGWFNNALRMQQYSRVASIINLRTHKLPALFCGNPTSANLNANTAVKNILWENDSIRLYMAGNFSAEGSLNTTVPTGTWYEYFSSKEYQGGSTSLAPGELLLLLSDKKLTPIEEVETNASAWVYPTYTQQMVYFREPCVVSLYDIAGRLCLSATNTTEIDVSLLEDGMYLIHLTANNGQSHHCEKIYKY